MRASSITHGFIRNLLFYEQFGYCEYLFHGERFVKSLRYQVFRYGSNRRHVRSCLTGIFLTVVNSCRESGSVVAGDPALLHPEYPYLGSVAGLYRMNIKGSGSNAFPSEQITCLAFIGPYRSEASPVGKKGVSTF